MRISSRVSVKTSTKIAGTNFAGSPRHENGGQVGGERCGGGGSGGRPEPGIPWFRSPPRPTFRSVFTARRGRPRGLRTLQHAFLPDLILCGSSVSRDRPPAASIYFGAVHPAKRFSDLKPCKKGNTRRIFQLDNSRKFIYTAPAAAYRTPPLRGGSQLILLMRIYILNNISSLCRITSFVCLEASAIP